MAIPKLAPNRLGSLPTEILLMIANYLSKASKALFSVISRSVYEKIGTQFLDRSLLTFSEREEFLITLQKDLDDCIYCYRCRRIHAVREDRSVGWCARCDASRSLYHSSFSQRRVQLAMKLHNAGKNPAEQLRHLSRTWNPTPQYRREVEARICSGSLILKDEHLMHLPSCSEKTVILGYEFRLCHHLAKAQELSTRSKIISDMIHCKLEHTCDREECSCNRVVTCPTCPTEITVEVRNDSDGKSLVVTAWKYFGRGGSPYEQAWSSHFFVPFPPPDGSRESTLNIKSIRASFHLLDAELTGSGMDAVSS